MKRLLTAGILIPVILYAVFWGPGWFVWGVIATVASLCFVEYCQILQVSLTTRIIGLVAGWGLLVVPVDRVFPGLVLFALLALILPMREVDLRGGFVASAAIFLGVVYVFGSMKTAFLLYQQGAYWLCFPLAINWIGDSGAYYIGRKFGTHKLAPRVSPGKSWEGTGASVLFSVLFTVLVLPRWIPGMTIPLAALYGVAGNIAGQVGDLAESALKRAMGVKDSGKLLPGHGGMLDRMDSALFTLPVTYGLLLWLRL